MDTLETDRLLLRKWQGEDADPFTAINQDPKVIEFLRGPMTYEQVVAFMAAANQHIEKHGYGLWAATLKTTQALIGFIGLSIPAFEAHFTPCVEIGWRLGSAFWGKGYATEGAKAVLQAGFETFDLNEIVSFTTYRNLRSIHVMEKIGLQRDREGDFDYPLLDKAHPLVAHVLYRLSQQDYLKKIKLKN